MLARKGGGSANDPNPRCGGFFVSVVSSPERLPGDDVNEPIDWTLLDRYLAGEASPEAAARVERWLAESPERAEMVRALRGAGADSADDARTDRAWASLS